ncbi:MAG: hypothetical protein HQ478_04885 [Chloroflexi bacterium]|nr:hypothetical protein [Chloroflexota bacterium]
MTSERMPTSDDRLDGIRARARDQLSAEEARHVKMLLTKPHREWEIKFDQLQRSYHKMLYVFTVLDESLSIAELRYLLIALWKSNTDAESLRQRIATAVEQEEIRWQRGRYNITPMGIEHMYNIENGILIRNGQRAPEDDRRREFDSPRGRDDRGGSSFDDRRGPPSRDDRGGPPSRGGSSYDDRRGPRSREDRGGPPSRGGSSNDDRRGPPSRDDRGGPPSRGGSSYGDRRGPPSRDDRGGPPSRGGSSYGDRRGPPSRDDRGGPPSRGGSSYGDRRGPPSRDDRGGPSGPPRRDGGGQSDRNYGSRGR